MTQDDGFVFRREIQSAEFASPKSLHDLFQGCRGGCYRRRRRFDVFEDFVDRIVVTIGIGDGGRIAAGAFL